MKRLICILLALTLLGSLWACTTAPVDDTEGSEPPISQTPPETDPPAPPETDAPTEPPTETDPPETEFVPPEGTLLTEAELEEFRALFAFRPSPSWYNMALTSVYDSPENVNWSQFFYMGFEDVPGVPFSHLSEEERVFWERNGQGISVDIYRMPLDKMDAVAMEYFGLTIDESNLVGLQGAHICFFPETNSYYICHGDMGGVEHFDMHSGAVLEDGTIRLYYYREYHGEMVVTLQPRTGEGETGYYILSNQLRES